MTSNEITTQSDIAVGPLAGAAEYLLTQGWVSVDVPIAKRPQQQIVVLVGPGGVLVVGTHKTSDVALGDQAGVVTASLPARLRGVVVTENGHDPHSLPALAAELGQHLNESDIAEAVNSLSRVSSGLLTVARVLEWTRDAKPAPSANKKSSGKVVRFASFLTKYSMLIALFAIILTAIVFGLVTSNDTVAATHSTAVTAHSVSTAAVWGSFITAR